MQLGYMLMWLCVANEQMNRQNILDKKRKKKVKQIPKHEGEKMT